MRSIIVSILTMVMLSLTLTACSNNSAQNYYLTNSETLPQLVVPSGIQDPTQQSYYPVPPILRSVEKPPLFPPGNLMNSPPLPAPSGTK